MKRLEKYKHWVVLACISGLAGSSIGINMNTIGVFYTPVAESLGFYRGSFALHTTILSLVMSATALMIPRILKKIEIKKMIIFGVVLTVLSTFAMAFTRDLWGFYLLAALRGFGAAFYSPVPLTILVNNWFDKKNGLALSLGFGSSGMVGALMTPIFSSVILHYNWQTGFMVMAFMALLFSLPSFLIPFRLHPEEEGLLPYGEKYPTVEDNEIHEEKQVDSSVIDSRFYILATVGLLLALITGFPHHLSGHAESIGFTTTIGAWMLSASMLGNIGFKLLAGTLGDWIGSLRTTMLVLSLNIMAILLLIFVHTSSVMILSSFLLGGIMCFPIVILPMLSINLYGRKKYMKVYPFFAFMTGVGGAVGVSVIGYVYDFTASYRLAFYGSLCLIVFSASLILFGTLRANRQKRDQGIVIEEK